MTSEEMVALFKKSNPGLRRPEGSLADNEEALRQVKGGLGKNQTEDTALLGSCIGLEESPIQPQEVVKRMMKLTDNERRRVIGMKEEIKQLQENIKSVVSDVWQQLLKNKEEEDVKKKGKEVTKAALDQTNPGLTDKIDKLEKLLDRVSSSDTASATSEQQHATDIADSSNALSPTLKVVPTAPISTLPMATIQAPARLLPVRLTTEANQCPVASLSEPEVTAAAAPTPVQTGYSLTPAIARTTSSSNNIKSQLSQLSLSTEGGSVPPAVDHRVDALRIAPVALGGGLRSLSLNPTTNSLLQGLQRPLLPTTDRQAS